jgi:3-hydroxyacyl-CoA dehydrogenase
MDPESVKSYIKRAEAGAWDIGPLPDVPLKIESVGVLGSGTMGQGIAMTYLSIGIPVVLCDIAEPALFNAAKMIEKNYMTTVKKGRITEEQAKKALSLLTKTTDMADFRTVDLVIEAVFENMDLKKRIFGQLDKLCKPGCILASNTSALDIDEIANSTSRPESVVGAHYFSPANVMRLLEIIKGKKTSPQVLSALMQVAKKTGKQAVLAGNCHGFIGNRMLYKRQDLANDMLMTGKFSVCSPYNADFF